MTGTAIARTKAIGYPGFRVLFVAWRVLAVLAYRRYFLLTGDLNRGLVPELLGWLYLLLFLASLESSDIPTGT